MKVKKEKVKIITLGCSKNLVDSEVISAQLKTNNIEIITDDKKCDTVIINTCGFIEDARQESIETILNAVKNKKQNKIKNLYVAGCLSERYQEQLKTEIPEVDKFFDTTDKPKTLLQILKTFGTDYQKELTGERDISPPRHYAYLKISEGCDNPCSFCSIPLMRGKHISKPYKLIIKEAEYLAEKGVKEIIIIGQDTTYWGFDKTGRRELSKVLEGITRIDGIEWIRLMYAYPSRFPKDVIDIIKDYSNICKYIDIPIQHISDNVLKSMRRGINRKSQIKLLDYIRNRIPEIAIRTTLMTGFPAETEQNFQELVKYIMEFKFDRLGVFTYSFEEGTFAEKLGDTIPKKEKLRRQKILLETQKEISARKNYESIGRTYKVLIDRKDGNTFAGRTYMDAPEIDQEVIIDLDKSIQVGNFYDVKIYDAEEFDLFGFITK